MVWSKTPDRLADIQPRRSGIQDRPAIRIPAGNRALQSYGHLHLRSSLSAIHPTSANTNFENWLPQNQTMDSCGPLKGYTGYRAWLENCFQPYPDHWQGLNRDLGSRLRNLHYWNNRAWQARWLVQGKSAIGRYPNTTPGYFGWRRQINR